MLEDASNSNTGEEEEEEGGTEGVLEDVPVMLKTSFWALAVLM